MFVVNLSPLGAYVKLVVLDIVPAYCQDFWLFGMKAMLGWCSTRFRDVLLGNWKDTFCFLILANRKRKRISI